VERVAEGGHPPGAARRRRRCGVELRPGAVEVGGRVREVAEGELAATIQEVAPAGDEVPPNAKQGDGFPADQYRRDEEHDEDRPPEPPTPLRGFQLGDRSRR